VHLLVIGDTVDDYDVAAEATALGIGDAVTVVGPVPDESMAEYLEAADVGVCLRWPSPRDTSAAWLRWLAAGRPTIVTALAHMADAPMIDAQSWRAAGDHGRDDGLEPPVGVSVDLADEEPSLKVAMRRLAADAALRSDLGTQARRLWAARFTLDAMVAAYRRLVATALERSGPSSDARDRFPAHVRSDGTEFLRRTLTALGQPVPDPF
jgi:glycosyltransferase involved in cell wall biosynthesis